ncbi:MAG: acyl-CoA dehydrogenase family protein [Chloroflexi bacterium]|nr:acyl-CoA dehydrogenase family protein [Chloroflexota bacterium]
MEFDLSFEQQALRQMVHDFADKEVAPVAEELDGTGRFPYEIVGQLGKLGLLGLPFPEKYGGGGADTVSYVIAIEELARVDSSVGATMAASISLGGMPIYLFGTEEQKQRWLRPLAEGKCLGAFGLTEPGAGSDAGATATTARLDGDEWVIDGTKCFITNAGTDISGFVTITVVTGWQDGKKQISSIVVPGGTSGYTQGPPYSKLGWRASDTRELVFTGCRVPKENILGQPGSGFRQFLAVLDGGRVSISGLGIGLAQGALDMSLAYAKERVQFGQTIASFQAIQFKLADMATEIELARLITYKAATLKDRGKPFSKEAAMAKLFSSETAVRAAEQAVQIHGGSGYMNEHPASRFYRDAKILTIGEGTSEVQRLVIARLLGC